MYSFDMVVSAISILVEPSRIAFLFLGVIFGLILGVIPGLGGLLGLSLLLPFTFTMDPMSGLGMMLGLLAATSCSDSIPAVLLGVPGTVGAAATIVDGNPMARNGEAGRALSASFLSSMFGGIFGAVLLAVSIPILQPLLLTMGTPELVAICLFGLSMVAVLSSGMVLKGLVAASLGVLISTTGIDANTGAMRWTFGTLYLWDGIPIIPLTLGLFALPELAELFAKGVTSISKERDKSMMNAGRLQGLKDVLSNKFLLLRCSFIGAGLGAIPGIGAAVIDWIAYGHAKRSERNPERFGLGDVRGVIATESANSAKDGGALVPTIAFGVPGSPPMALLLGAFLVHNITPGPEMLGSRIDITYALVWSIALANAFGAFLCFLFVRQFARVAEIRTSIILPIILSIIFVGSYQSSHEFGDFWALLAFGVLGWIMKQLNWPRPPLMLGFVLGALIENYLFISVQRYGAEWLWHPLVMAILGFTILWILVPAVGSFFRRSKMDTRVSAPRVPLAHSGFTASAAIIFGSALLISRDWPTLAQIVPQIICWVGLIFSLAQLAAEYLGRRGTSSQELSATENGVNGSEFGRRTIIYGLWCMFILGGTVVVGLLPTVFLTMVLFMRIHGREKWLLVISIAVVSCGLMWLIFDEVAKLPWPHSLLGDIFPFLRAKLGIV